jgi:transcriptional regulator with XRE-family HTH domain
MVAPPAQFTQPVDGDPIIASLRDRREALGLLQKDVAAVAGCHTQHYGQIERGAISPQFRTLRAILAALGCDLTLRPGGQQAAESGRVAYAVRLEAELAEVRSKLETSNAWRIVADQRQRIERLGAETEQLHARAIAAEGTVSEVREDNRKLRKEVTRVSELRDRFRTEAQEATRLQAELDQVNAELRRTRAAMDALARQPVLTHELLDHARKAILGRGPR